MSEMMLFPKTWEEFEKHYGFYDSKQAYMFGNTRLIPSFRVQQWLDHIDDIKRKKQSQTNKVEQVAALFGKKLGEEFVLSEHRSRYSCLYEKSEKQMVFNPHYGWTIEYKDVSDIPDCHYVKCKITTEGLFKYNTYKNYWQKDEDDLSDLLTGRAVIIDD